MNDLTFLARAVLGGFGGNGKVDHCDPLGPHAGKVAVTATDAFGNTTTAVVPLAEWHAALAAEIAAFPH